MKDKQYKHLLFAFAMLSALIMQGCAVGGIRKGLVPQCPEGQWTRLPQESSYRCEYVCEDNTVQLRYVPLDTVGFIGPPLLPLIPVPVSEPKKLLFDIHLINKKGVLPSEPLSVQVKLPSTTQPCTPVNVVDLQKNMNVMKEEGMYHVDVLMGGRGSLFRTYLYKFDIERKDITNFELIFQSDFNGCSIPPIRYEIKSKPAYKPLVAPGG